MEAKQIKELDAHTLVRVFADAVQSYFEASEAAPSDDEEVTRRFDYKNLLMDELKCRSANEFAVLKGLLSDARPSVRLWTAYELVELYPDDVKETYQDLIRYRNSIGINAGIALERINGIDILAKYRNVDS